MMTNVFHVQEIIMLMRKAFVSRLMMNANTGKSVEFVPDVHTDGLSTKTEDVCPKQLLKSAEFEIYLLMSDLFSYRLLFSKHF